MGSSSSNKKKSKRSSRQQDDELHNDGNDHQQQRAFFNNDFYAEQTPLRRRENDSIFSAVDAPMYSDYPNNNSSSNHNNNNNNAGSTSDLLFMHSARTRKSNNSSFYSQYSQQHSTTVDRWVKQAMRFILLSPVIVLVLWWTTAVLFVNHHSQQQQQQHSHSQQQQHHQQQTVNSNRRGFSLPAAFKPYNRQAQAQAIHQNNNLNNIQQNHRKFFPFGAAPQSSQQQVIRLPPSVGDSGVGGYALLNGQQPQFISQDQQPMVGSDYGGQEQVLLPMVGNDGAPLIITQPQLVQPVAGIESAAQRGMMMMAEQPNDNAPMGKTFVYYSPPTGTFPPMHTTTSSSTYNAPLMGGASSSYNAPLMGGAASSYNAPMMGSTSDNTDINGNNPLLMLPPLERRQPRAGTALSDYVHQQSHQGHGLLRGTSSTTSNTRYYYYDPNQVVMDAQNNVQQLPDVIYDQAGNAVLLDQLTQVAQTQQLPIYLKALEEQERNPFGVHHFSNGTNFNSTTGTVTTTNYTQTHPNTVETPVHRQMPYYPPVGGAAASIVEAAPVQQLSLKTTSSSSFSSWGENTAADNSIILCTVAVMALLVGALSARRLRARSILSACIENESLTTRNQEAYDAAYTMNDEGGAYATFAAPAASHWKGDLEKFDV
jgi:hypothetical protein